VCFYPLINKIHKYSQRLSLKPKTHTHTHTHTTDRHAQDESSFRILRDMVRALIWFVFLWDGSFVSTLFHPDRTVRDETPPPLFINYNE
jgi:hypothetical protein